jgi:MoaA/NifB/PqqE/SkfB family radical SAM enzyme
MKPRFALRLAPAIWRMYVKKPVFLSYNITNRCNQRCRMCNVWRLEAQELTLIEIRRILAEAKECGIRIIELTGGETFLRKDFFEICSILDEYGLLYTTTTNGTLIDDAHVERLRTADGLLQIAVSVDSLDRDLYARLRGQDHLPRVLENLERLAKARLPVPVKVNFTLSRHNYQEAFRMLDYVQSLGLFMSLFPVNQGPQSQHRSYDPFFISPERERDIADFTPLQRIS